MTERAPLPTASIPATRWLLYLGLGVVVWGLFVPDEGLWHDDVQTLFRAFLAPERGEGLFPAIATPTRRLLGLPFIAALATGWPVQALHLLCSLAWIATAVLADRLARRLWPDRPLAAPLAGALTLCATPDLFTAAPVAIGYQQSIVLYVCAALLGLVWLQSGSRPALWATPVALSASLWTSDAAVAVWPLTPLLWAAAPGARGRRAVPLGVLWFLAPVPYVITLPGLIAGEGSYLRQALVPLDAGQWIARFIDLLAWNVTPWRWALDRPLWYPSAGSVVPPSVRWTIALGVGALAAWALFRRAGRREATGPSGAWAAVASVALMASANAPFASVRYAEFYYRTHLLSRVFVSVALAWLTAVAWSRARAAARMVLAAAVAAWLSLGIASALARQDYFVSYTRAYRQELSSILTAAPALAPDAVLLLRAPAHSRFLATETGTWPARGCRCSTPIRASSAGRCSGRRRAPARPATRPIAASSAAASAAASADGRTDRRRSSSPTSGWSCSSIGPRRTGMCSRRPCPRAHPRAPITGPRNGSVPRRGPLSRTRSSTPPTASRRGSGRDQGCRRRVLTSRTVDWTAAATAARAAAFPAVFSTAPVVASVFFILRRATARLIFLRTPSAAIPAVVATAAAARPVVFAIRLPAFFIFCVLVAMWSPSFDYHVL